MLGPTVFSVQDETGTVTQVTLVPSPLPTAPIRVGDTGIYSGIPDDGTNLSAVPAFRSLPFTVAQVLDNGYQFSVATINANLADWPANGQIVWSTGGNATTSAAVIQIDGANAYADVPFLLSYLNARGIVLPTKVLNSDDAILETALVQATDYLDQKYRYQGVKLLQQLGSNSSAFGYGNAEFYASWMTPYAVNSSSYLTPSVTTQSTEWPRQGVVDYSGNTVNGIPKQIKQAACELALRVLNGVVLQPDFDASLVGAGGIVSSLTEKIGPLETSVTYDTKMGLGFFANFPQVDRMLSRAGLLLAGGGRTIIR